MTVHAIRCPQCSAMLDVTAGASILRCSFCSTPCRVDWHGSDPVLTEEAEEFARLMRGFDFDTLERGLESLEDYVDERSASDELATAVERLEQREQIDRLAEQLASSGKAHEFIQGVSSLEIDESEEHEVLLRDLLSRVAVRAAALADEIERRTPPAKYNVMQHSGAGHVHRAWTSTVPVSTENLDVDRQLERKVKCWRWMPWVGLLLLPLMLIGLAVVSTIAIAVAMPQHEDRPWLGLAFGVAVLASPVTGIVWLWFGLKRRKALVAQRRVLLGRDALS